MKIQANHSGTRSIEVTENHLMTIDRYALLRNLVDSNGIVDEDVLDKLKFNVRSMLESETGTDKDLLDLCLDVIYNANMKAFGLHQLVLLYIDWKSKRPVVESEEDELEVTD
jgi:replicative superfamily II helicase